MLNLYDLNIEDILRRRTDIPYISERYFSFSIDGNEFAFSLAKKTDIASSFVPHNPIEFRGKVLLYLGPIVNVEGKRCIISEKALDLLLAASGIAVWPTKKDLKEKEVVRCTKHSDSCPGVMIVDPFCKRIPENTGWSCSLPDMSTMDSDIDKYTIKTGILPSFICYHRFIFFHQKDNVQKIAENKTCLPPQKTIDKVLSVSVPMHEQVEFHNGERFEISPQNGEFYSKRRDEVELQPHEIPLTPMVQETMSIEQR